MNSHYCLKSLVLFFIFATGCCGDKHHHRTIALFNKSICKSLKDNSDAFIPFKKRVVYYACKNCETRKGSKPIRGSRYGYIEKIYLYCKCRCDLYYFV